MKFPAARLIQFAKLPRRGQVKTRLSPFLDEESILELHCRLVLHTNGLLNKSALAPVEFYYDGPAVAPLNHLFPGVMACQSRQQTGADLGERMHHAFVNSLRPRGGAEFAVIVGSDCPLLREDILEEALNVLNNGIDTVLGPAEDGGYYLVGLRRPEELIFQNIPWGSENVLSATLDVAALNGLQTHLLEPLPDIDRPGDLALLDKIPFFASLK